MQLTLTPLADFGVSVLPPDIVWLRPDGRPAGPGEPGVVGDFAVSVRNADGPIGGLVAANPLLTAVVMLLFTDARADLEELTEAHGGDRRGWAGDGFDVDTGNGEAPLGSKLWLYRRAVMNEMTGFEVAAEAKRALQPLIGQHAVVSVEASCDVDLENDALFLTVALYGRDGREIFNAKFDPLWRRVDGRL